MGGLETVGWQVGRLAVDLTGLKGLVRERANVHGSDQGRSHSGTNDLVPRFDL